MRTTLGLGGTIAVGIGLGVALAASMGATGYAVGQAAALLAFRAVPMIRDRMDPLR